MATDKNKNVMKELKVDKLVINCCIGESGDRLTRAAKVLEQLTDKKPVYSKGFNFCVYADNFYIFIARYTVRAFGIRRNEKIAVHVTVIILLLFLHLLKLLVRCAASRLRNSWIVVLRSRSMSSRRRTSLIPEASDLALTSTLTLV